LKTDFEPAVSQFQTGFKIFITIVINQFKTCLKVVKPVLSPVSKSAKNSSLDSPIILQNSKKVLGLATNRRIWQH
jgi:hypothetical protein